jgi:hypothetical protein
LDDIEKYNVISNRVREMIVMVSISRTWGMVPYSMALRELQFAALEMNNAHLSGPA